MATGSAKRCDGRECGDDGINDKNAKAERNILPTTSVSVVAGQGLYYMYFNIVSSVLQTYVVEVEPYSAAIVICFMNFVKCVYAFGVPFFEPAWVLPSSSVFETSFIVQMVVTVVLSLLSVSLALFLRNGAFKWRADSEHDGKRRLAMQVPVPGKLNVN